MSSVELFLEDVVSDMRATLAGARDARGRGAIEDRIALLTDYRLAGMDEAAFARLLGMMRGGRSPVALRTAAPAEVAGDLSRRWKTYRVEGVTPSRGPSRN